MKKKIEISASFSGKIPTGNFENESPFYAVKEVIEYDDALELACVPLNHEIKARQKELHDICYNQFKAHAEAAYSERIAKTYQNIRFYDGENGQKYPSVTSIIGWDADFFMPPEELAQHASRGSIIDKQVEIYLMTGQWKEPKEIPEIYPDLAIVKNGNLGLLLDDSDFRAFYAKYPFKVLALQDTLLNHKHKYGGRRDIKCVIESTNKGCWDKVEGVIFDVPTILDVKAGAMDKPKFMKQQTAYWLCDDEVKQVGIIHLNKETQQGFSKPVIETNQEKYLHLFLKDRENFRKRYGI